MYAKCFKRVIDFTLSLIALVILFPVLLILTVIGAIAMKGNPFFTQARPGKISKKTGEEKVFKLVKFRTMSNAKDKEGNLLPDDVRLNKYGRFLRSTSLDELPELWNILKGDMAIVGPRPLATQYLPYYTERERQRHSVRPGLTGLAQVSGRNSLKWEEKFEYDLEYVGGITLVADVKILFRTVQTVFKREDIGVRGTETLMDFDAYRKKQWEESENVH